jgi:hypothetical protein
MLYETKERRKESIPSRAKASSYSHNERGLAIILYSCELNMSRTRIKLSGVRDSKSYFTSPLGLAMPLYFPRGK